MPAVGWLLTRRGRPALQVPWNFEKYLVGKDGVPVKKSGASASPAELKSDIQKMLDGQL